MSDDIQRMKDEIEKLNKQCLRQQSIIKKLYEDLALLQGREDDVPYVYCFFSMPFKEEYDLLFNAVRYILEDAPYGWRVVRADAEHLGATISLNVEKHITASHCYIAEISDKKPNVFLEIGRMSHYSRIDNDGHDAHRPLIYLCREDAKNSIAADLSGYIYHSYASCDGDAGLTYLARHLREEFDKKPLLKALKNKKNKEVYLSSEILVRHHACQPDLAYKLVGEYTTAEALLKRSPEKVAAQLKMPQLSVEVYCVQCFLEDHFQLPHYAKI